MINRISLFGSKLRILGEKKRLRINLNFLCVSVRAARCIEAIMPPKKAPNKNDIKKKQKIVEDKTFGMKNKKGAAAQKLINDIKKNTLGNLKVRKCNMAVSCFVE